ARININFRCSAKTTIFNSLINFPNYFLISVVLKWIDNDKLMQLDFNVYSIILLISGIAAALFSVFIFYRLGGTVKWFALTMLNVSIWVFFYGLELASLNFSAMYFWIRIEYIGIAFTPVTWLLFSFKYTDKEAW